MNKSTFNKHTFFPVLALTLTGLFFIISSCGGGGGGGSSSHAPAISGLSYNPSFATQNQGGGQIAVSIYLNFTDQGGDVSSATISTFDAQGVMDFTETVSLEGGPGITSGYLSGTLYVDTTKMGTWTFEVYVTDSAGSNSNKLTGTFSITAALLSITVTPTNPSIANGTTQQFTATGSFSDASTKDLTAQVIWSSSDTNKATIDSSGLARGTGVGSTTITAVYESISGFTTLTVTPAVIVSINISPTNPFIPRGVVQQFTALGRFSDGTIQDVTAAVNWASSDTVVATISNLTGSNGKASSISSGITTITASSGSVSDSTVLTVTPWKKITSGTAENLSDVVWSGTQFVIVGWGGQLSYTGDILTSPDGDVWTKRATVGQYLYGITYSGSVYVAVGDREPGGGSIFTSSDGALTWTEQNNDSNAEIYDVLWSGSQFVAVGYGIFTSPDGITWTSRKDEFTAPILYSIAWDGTQYVAVGTSILTSTDGVTWTKIMDSVYGASGLTGVTWTGSQFIATGAEGTILTSPDGVTWTQQNSGVTVTLHAVASSPTEVIVVGVFGTALRSSNGITWTPLATSVENHLWGITWSGTKFIAVGYDGIILEYP